MGEKLLSTECVEYCKALKRFNTRFGKTKYKLYNKISDIVLMYDTTVYSINFYDLTLDNKTLEITYSDGVDQFEYSIPIEWLDLPWDEVRDLIKAQKEEQKKKEGE